MKLHNIAAVVALVAAGSANANISLLDSSMYPSLLNTTGATIGGVTFASAGDVFQQKGQDGISGLGVKGKTNGEIDVGEKITMSWASGLKIASFSVGLLFNGPEYSDYAEIAQVTAWTSSGTKVGQLQVNATGTTGATFSGTGFGTVVNLKLAENGKGGAWQVDNPFGNELVTKLEFTALDSKLCWGTPGKDCTNQSDYVLSSVTAVPEPGTYAMFAAGLGALGFVARRRQRRD